MPERTDPGARILELGLAAVLLLAPLPFGSVVPEGRLALELAALALLVAWLVRVWTGRPPVLPPRAVCIGMLGLLALAVLQAVPLPLDLVRRVAPRATEIREAAQPPPQIQRAEAQLLGVDLLRFDPPATISVDPGATASALRTGAALAALLLVATTVAATRGVRLLALAFLASAAFQGLYGILVLASGHDRIWHVPKRYALDAATGTFVNRNHFACLLAMSLACGVGLILHEARPGSPSTFRQRLVRSLGPAGSRILLLVVLLIIGVAGLLASLSRAGIAVGLFALALTVVAGGRAQPLGSRIVIVALVVALAVLPLVQIGSDRLVQRFERSADDIQLAGGRGTVWLDTLELAGEFPVFGSGFGTFAQVYPLYRAPEVRKFYDHVHNDLLQAVAEGGLVGCLPLALVLLPILAVMVAGVRGTSGTLGVGFAAGLAALLLHSLVDFDFHIPANAATGAILAGSLLGLPWFDRA